MTTSFRLPSELEQRLDTLAKQTGRTKTYYLRELIETGLKDLEDRYLPAARIERTYKCKEQLSQQNQEQDEEHRRLTLEALADVDAGRVIDYQAVQSWANSLDTDNPLPIPGQ